MAAACLKKNGLVFMSWGHEPIIYTRDRWKLEPNLDENTYK